MVTRGKHKSRCPKGPHVNRDRTHLKKNKTNVHNELNTRTPKAYIYSKRTAESPKLYNNASQ